MARFRNRKPKKIIEAHSFEAGDLKAFANRLERIDADISALREDRKHVMLEADKKGFHKKILTRALADWRREKAMTDGEKECFDLYRDALSGTPLGKAAKEREERAETKPRKGANNLPFQHHPSKPDAFEVPPIPKSLRRKKSDDNTTVEVRA